MNIDRVVVTTFPGYFFSTLLCLQSIEKFVPGVDIDIIVDDFGLNQWPTYVDDCKQYISTNCPTLNIKFHTFSQIPTVDRARAGGWFRQQLIKLHLDQILDSHSWLLIDADVVLKDFPDTTTVPVLPHPAEPVDYGNRHYVGHLLAHSTPWLDPEEDFLCASGIPIRYITRHLLTSLRNTVEQIHQKSFLDLHLDLIAQQDIVAFDPLGAKMIMSEFQLIEVYRNRLYPHSLPLRRGANNFDHTSIKDWKLGKAHFEKISVPDTYWKKMIDFASTYI